MARKSSNFMIGLFVSVGVVLGVAAIVWLGASKYFEEGSLYVTYFDESVQGLQVDSRVKYRGVDIGKVQSIGVAPDRRLVEVVMKIGLDGETQRNVVAQLRAAGITGIVFIELDRRSDDDPLLTPPSGMETRYPVIPSQLSQTRQMLSSVDRIMNRIEQVDLRGSAEQLKQTSLAVETFLTGKPMAGILAKLDSTAGSLDQTSRAVESFIRGKPMTGILQTLDSTAGSLDATLKRIDGILAAGKVEGILEEGMQGLKETRQGIAETRRAIAEIRELADGVRTEVKNLKLAETVDRTAELIAGIDRRTRDIKNDFERTADEIQQATESLKLLLDRVRENPWDLIFNRPADDLGPQGLEVKK